VDIFAPQIISSSVADGATLPASVQMLNFTFDEPLDPATVTTGNLVVQHFVGSIQFRVLEYTLANSMGGISMYLPNSLKPGLSYRLQATRLADTAGNAMPVTPPLVWTFSVAPETYTFTSIDSLNRSVGWHQPQESPSTSGLDSGNFSYSTERVFPFLFSGRGSARLRYSWDTTAGSPLLEILSDSVARTIEWGVNRTILRAHIHGDGSGTEVRFVLEDSVEAFPFGPPEHREVSGWFPIRWVGWRAVSWHLDRDTVGSWTGDGILQGSLRLRGLQLRRVPGGAASGVLHVAGIEVAQQVIASVEGRDQTLPETYALYQNYPNPFNPSTRLRFEIPERGHVTLGVFDVLGRPVTTLLDAPRAAGRHEVEWNAASSGEAPASGVYIVHFTVRREGGAQVHSSTLKVMLLK
jgi:hypothetical protein